MRDDQPGTDARRGEARALDVEWVRRQFPALAGDWVFLDNAGGSQVLGRVADRLHDYLLTSNVQLGATYAPSRAAAARVAAGAEAMAAFLGAAGPDEIVLGPSTTRLLADLARAMAGQLQPGDEIVVTNLDHEANIGPWRGLADAGVTIREWQVDPETLRLELADLDRLMSPRTRLVCFSHASNVLGTIHPVAEITRFVHERGARVCVDGVAFAPHRPADVGAWDVDFYAFSLYKVFGPHCAVLYGKRAVLAELDSINHFFIGRDDVPYKLQPGSFSYEAAFAATGITDYFAELAVRAGIDGVASAGSAHAALAWHEEALAERLLSFLNQRPTVRVIGSPTSDRHVRVPTISFVVDGRDSAEIVSAVDAHRIGTRYGHFYAKRLIDALGLAGCNGVVRVSMVHYNTQDEVDRLVACLETVL